MNRITIAGAGLLLLAGIASADAQSPGYGPGVNPFNPQDMSNRSNPQDLTAPGGSNRQDLVRRPPSTSAPVLVSPPRATVPQYTGKAKAKQKAAKTKSKQKATKRRTAAARD